MMRIYTRIRVAGKAFPSGIWERDKNYIF